MFVGSLNDTSTTRLQMTAELQAEMTALLNKYKNIEGDYEATVIGGVWHYMCDSGIMTDAFSVNDRKVIDEKFAHLLEEDEDGDLCETDEWYEAVQDADGLDFNELRYTLQKLNEKYDVYDEDLARELRFMEMDANGE